jgi:hypothetical protein
MTNVRNLIGFDTPSKAEAQEQMKGATGLDVNGEPKVNVEKLKAETVQKVEKIGAVIIGSDFAGLTQRQRAGYLMEFVYLTKIADSL